MAMTKDQIILRKQNIDALMGAFPCLIEEQATKLQDKLYSIATQVKRMEERYCNEPDLDDLRTEVRSKARANTQKVLDKFGIACDFNLSTDARGHGLWLHLPTGRYNSMGGEESGWGF